MSHWKRWAKQAAPTTGLLIREVDPGTMVAVEGSETYERVRDGAPVLREPFLYATPHDCDAIRERAARRAEAAHG